MGEKRKSVSLHCTPGVYSSNSLAKATVGEPEKDKIVLSLGRVNIPNFAGYSLSILNILVWRAEQRESLTRQGSKAGKIRVRTGRESDRLR